MQVEWGALVAGAGGSALSTVLLRLLVASWLKKRESHEERMDFLVQNLREKHEAEVAKRERLEDRVLRLEGDVRTNKRESEGHERRVEKKLDRILRWFSNLTMALAARGIKVREVTEPDDDELDGAELAGG